MKRRYMDVGFSPKNELLLGKIQKILAQYKRLGYKLTLRQLYYQMVANDIVPNKVSEYQKLSTLLKNARLGGYVDWVVIEDRGRVPKMKSQFDNLKDLMDAACHSFRLPRWDLQEFYVELWSEKDALTSILLPITEKYHSRLVVNKGYSSTSAMYKSAMRFIDAKRRGKTCILLYLGDFDPSGIDMDRDIEDRLEMFRCYDVEFIRIGLTEDQIEELSPPPNPAKVTDPRANDYIEKYGDISWEVDAIPPDILDKLVEKAILEYVDEDQYEYVIKQEERLKAWLLEQIEDDPKFTEFVGGWDGED